MFIDCFEMNACRIVKNSAEYKNVKLVLIGWQVMFLKKTVNSINNKLQVSYVAVFVIWILISVLLIWNLGRGLFSATVFRVLYLVISALMFYLMLKRERVLTESRNEFNQLLNTMLEPSILHEES